MAATPATDPKTQIAYVPYKTFKNAIEQLDQHGLPNRIDRTLWPSFSGVIQAQLMSAFKFFGLIFGDGTPTNKLELLVRDRGNRKAHLREMLKAAYPELISIDLTKATIGQFNEAMRQYELSAETTRKASSFFLQAAKDAELPMSKHIIEKTRTVGPKRRKPATRPRTEAEAMQDAATVSNPHPAMNGPSRAVNLDNGIVLSLSTSADTFKMSKRDRDFVLTLLEQIEEYEQTSMDDSSGDEIQVEEENQS